MYQSAHKTISCLVHFIIASQEGVPLQLLRVGGTSASVTSGLPLMSLAVVEVFLSLWETSKSGGKP